MWYGTGHVLGYTGQDVVTLGNLVFEPYTHNLGRIVEVETDVFLNYGGILGMSFPEMAEPGIELMFDQMISQGVLDQNIFTFVYYPDELWADIQFGSLNETIYTGDIKWHDVIVRAHWTVNMVDALVGDEPMNICPDGCHALVDTGTTLITFPTVAYW